jgi:hypothetical protein
VLGGDPSPLERNQSDGQRGKVLTIPRFLEAYLWDAVRCEEALDRWLIWRWSCGSGLNYY